MEPIGRARAASVDLTSRFVLLAQFKPRKCEQLKGGSFGGLAAIPQDWGLLVSFLFLSISWLVASIFAGYLPWSVPKSTTLLIQVAVGSRLALQLASWSSIIQLLQGRG